MNITVNYIHINDYIFLLNIFVPNVFTMRRSIVKAAHDVH